MLSIFKDMGVNMKIIFLFLTVILVGCNASNKNDNEKKYAKIYKKYSHHLNELTADELNEYAALLYYKDLTDQAIFSFDEKSDDEIQAIKEKSIKNNKEIEQLFKKAADHGSTLAKVNLAKIYTQMHYEYYNQDIDQQDPNQAPNVVPVIFQLYKDAAENGNADAQFKLGECYTVGWGTTIDYHKAMYWYKKSAQQGNPAAMNNIGMLYQRGLGVEKNGEISTDWYIKAANLGYSLAQHNMFQNYYNGQNGLPENEEKAMKWREKCSYRSEEIPIQPVFDLDFNITETYPNKCKKD
ncbi:hypothetical protein F971_02943 [Acinetobacter vivianii]|uniref:Sel1 repeat protein n=1 Tax=Acinetobacter vivianii TaxID=1776742 RepID=N8UWR7_9GAMM|nr:hypothetical protein F971_02943 [Acinetobacter vivianii]